ncbi:hypothetical protein ACX3YC_02670 [Pseudomonas mohnii]
MEPHQSRVVGAIAVAQQIPAEFGFAQLTIETQYRRDVLLRGLFAVGGVTDGVDLALDAFANDRLAAVGRQQYHALIHIVGSGHPASSAGSKRMQVIRACD